MDVVENVKRAAQDEQQKRLQAKIDALRNKGSGKKRKVELRSSETDDSGGFEEETPSPRRKARRKAEDEDEGEKVQRTSTKRPRSMVEEAIRASKKVNRNRTGETPQAAQTRPKVVGMSATELAIARAKALSAKNGQPRNAPVSENTTRAPSNERKAEQPTNKSARTLYSAPTSLYGTPPAEHDAKSRGMSNKRRTPVIVKYEATENQSDNVQQTNDRVVPASVSASHLVGGARERSSKTRGRDKREEVEAEEVFLSGIDDDERDGKKPEALVRETGRKSVSKIRGWLFNFLLTVVCVLGTVIFIDSLNSEPDLLELGPPEALQLPSGREPDMGISTVMEMADSDLDDKFDDDERARIIAFREWFNRLSDTQQGQYLKLTLEDVHNQLAERYRNIATVKTVFGWAVAALVGATIGPRLF